MFLFGLGCECGGWDLCLCPEVASSRQSAPLHCIRLFHSAMKRLRFCSSSIGRDVGEEQHLWLSKPSSRTEPSNCSIRFCAHSSDTRLLFSFTSCIQVKNSLPVRTSHFQFCPFVVLCWMILCSSRFHFLKAFEWTWIEFVLVVAIRWSELDTRLSSRGCRQATTVCPCSTWSSSCLGDSLCRRWDAGSYSYSKNCLW